MKMRNAIEHIVLGSILVGGLAAFYYVRPNESLQFITGTITSVAYVLWGIIHHALKKDLHGRVVIEYVLMGAIAIVLLATILKT
jgi:hypothetical protein